MARSFAMLMSDGLLSAIADRPKRQVERDRSRAALAAVAVGSLGWQSNPKTCRRIPRKRFTSNVLALAASKVWH